MVAGVRVVRKGEMKIRIKDEKKTKLGITWTTVVMCIPRDKVYVIQFDLNVLSLHSFLYTLFLCYIGMK